MKNGRILIVDDEEDLREVLAHQLKALGAHIDLAENGRIALEKARVTKYEAILSDISMPEMNGLEFLAQLREEGFDTPFVILTGFGDKAKAVEALRLGAFDFLEKPWETERLRSTMKRAFEHGIVLRGLEADLEKMISSVTLDPAAEASGIVGAVGDRKNDNLRRVQKSLMLMKMAKRQLGPKKTG